jgi:thioesterase domain-containing protein
MSRAKANNVQPLGGSAIVSFRVEGAKPPLFLIHGVDGTVQPFQHLVRHLESDRPLYGVLAQALLGERTVLTCVEDLAAYYIRAIQAVRPMGPYHFLGFSFGGLLAFEMARQLRARGEVVSMLGMLDTQQMGPHGNSEDQPQKALSGRWKTGVNHLRQLARPRGLQYAKKKLMARSLRTIYTVLSARGKHIPRFLRRAYDINWFAAANYIPQFYPERVTLFRASAPSSSARATTELWARLAGQGVELIWIPGGHEDILSEPHVISLANAITKCLGKVTQPASC